MSNLVTYGQVVVGPPGSGKTTYCYGMQQFLISRGQPTLVVNLDPANPSPPYDCAVDMQDLISLGDVMAELKLGPNGGLLYCMEFLEQNLEWLRDRLLAACAQQERDAAGGGIDGQAGGGGEGSPPPYIIFDFPGQVELYTHHDSVRNIMTRLKDWNYRLCAVHLVDAVQCCDAANFIAGVLVSLSTMLQLEMPHVNVLSKADLLRHYDNMAFDMDFYTGMAGLGELVPYIDQKPHDLRDDEEEEEEEGGDGEGEGEGEGGGEGSEGGVRGVGKGGGRYYNGNEMHDGGAGSGTSAVGADSRGFARGLSGMGRFKALNTAMCEIIEQFGLVQFVAASVTDEASMERVALLADKCNGCVYRRHVAVPSSGDGGGGEGGGGGAGGLGSMTLSQAFASTNEWNYEANATWREQRQQEGQSGGVGDMGDIFERQPTQPAMLPSHNGPVGKGTIGSGGIGVAGGGDTKSE